MKNSRTLVFLLGCALVAPAVARQAAPPTLTAEQVIENHIAASGGRAAYAKQKTVVTRGSLDIALQGIKGDIVTYQKEPDKLLVVTTITGIGKTRQAYDGKVAWSDDPMQGLRKLAGAEKEALMRSAGNATVKWKQYFTSVKVTGHEKVGDSDCYVLTFTPKVGNPIKQYFDEKTFLVLRVDTVQEGPTGTIPVQSYLTDYRLNNGVKVPFTTTMKIATVDVIFKVSSITVNEPIADALFAYPGGATPPKNKTGGK